MGYRSNLAAISFFLSLFQQTFLEIYLIDLFTVQSLKNFLKFASIIFVPLRFGWSLLWFTLYRGFTFWCFIIHRFFDSHSSCNAVFTSCASSFSLSSLGKISYIIVSQPFSLHVFAKRICLLAISSGSFFDLKSLVPICRINLSVFRRSVGLM